MISWKTIEKDTVMISNWEYMDFKIFGIINFFWIVIVHRRDRGERWEMQIIGWLRQKNKNGKLKFFALAPSTADLTLRIWRPLRLITIIVNDSFNSWFKYANIEIYYEPDFLVHRRGRWERREIIMLKICLKLSLHGSCLQSFESHLWVCER